MNNKCTFQFVAGWPILGEADGGGLINAHQWMNERLEKAYLDDVLTMAKVVDVTAGAWGLQYITFVGEIEMKMCHSMKATKKKLKRKLDKIVNDTDVEVHWINRSA